MIKLAVFVVLVLAVRVNAQFDPVDYFGPISCDDMLARVDNLAQHLRHDLNAHAFVVVSGGNEHLIKKLQLEILFSSSAIQRGLDGSRFTLIRGDEEGSPKMTFYTEPLGEKTPVAPSVRSLKLPPGTKASLFGWDEDGICSYPTVYKYLREILAANPALR
ncbi:MAG TPA: hypothetical protein VGI80_09380, partial [Pyrinomonadaceae bacterium]